MPDDLASAPGQLAHGTKEAATELLDVIFEWIVPIITLIVGYVMAASIGLSGALGTAIDGVLGATGMSGTTMNYLADLVAVLIWGCIGAGLWSAQKSIKGYGGYIMRPLATLFFGFAIGEVGALVSGKVLNGAIGKAISTVDSSPGPKGLVM